MGLFQKKEPPALLQSEVTECGLTCLAMIAAFHGHEIDMSSLRRRHNVSLRGLTLPNLLRAADDLGLDKRALRMELPDLNDLKLPAIIHWNENHFVVLTKIGGSKEKRYTLNDPKYGRRVLSESSFSRQFTGIAIEFTPSSRFEIKKDVRSISLRELVSKSSVPNGIVLQISALSIMIQTIVLIVPIILSILIDSIAPSGMRDQLLAFSVGIVFLCLTSAALFFIRSRILSDAVQMLNLQITSDAFRHALMLPLTWFEKRYVGDIISRFNSIISINDILSRSVTTVISDGITSIVCIIAIALFSWKIAAFSILLIAIYAVAQHILFTRTFVATQE